MKAIKIFVLLIFTPLLLLAQVDENSSETQTFSIRKEKKTENSSEDLQFSISKVKVSEKSARGTFNIKGKDETAPLITIISPIAKQGFKIIEENKFVTIIGKVEDESGIFEVLVNNKDLKVSLEGLFQVSIPLAFGDNKVIVKATDIKQNVGFIEFVIERKTSEITHFANTDNASDEIIWKSPAQNFYSTSLEKYNIQACIKSSSKIKEVRVLQNDWRINSKTLKTVDYNEVYDYNLNEPISLKLGQNQIKIEVVTEENIFESKINIIYNMKYANYHALIIGVQDYDDPAINDLTNPINDAQRLYNILTTIYTFEPEDIIFLKNPTKADIIGTLHKMRSTITSEDNLLIFYAGHGYWDEAMNNGYWLLRDANQDNPSNWLANTDLTNYLSVIKSKHTLLIADACFSGGIFKTRKAFNNTYAIEKLYKLPSRKAITSGTLKEVPDKSVFLQYFIKRLQENADNYLSSEQLFSSLRMAVINNSPNIPQYGTIQNVGDEGGDFIFIKRD